MSGNPTALVASAKGDDFLAFQREFEEHLNKLSEALAESKSVSSNASDIGNRGTLSMVWGSINGSNDKEFALMASQLAASLATTQVALQIVMQLSHRKHGFLKQFHQVLVDKIAGLTNDTRTLDHNQRDATIVILEEIESHVFAQLEQQEMVEGHEARLQSIDQYIAATDIQAGEFSNSISRLDAWCQELHEASEELRRLIAERFEYLKELGDQQALSLDKCEVRIAAQAQHHTESKRRADSLKAIVATQQAQLTAFQSFADELRIRVDEDEHQKAALVQETIRLKDQLAINKAHLNSLESMVAGMQTPKAVILRHAASFAALALAAWSLLTVGPFP